MKALVGAIAGVALVTVLVLVSGCNDICQTGAEIRGDFKQLEASTESALKSNAALYLLCRQYPRWHKRLASAHDHIERFTQAYDVSKLLSGVDDLDFILATSCVAIERADPQTAALLLESSREDFAELKASGTALLEHLGCKQ